jgi:hypothetical protein
MCPLRGHGRSGNFLPHLESFDHLLAVISGREAVASRAEVVRDEAIGCKKALRVSRGLEAARAPLSLAGRLVGILGAIIQISALPILNTGQDHAHGGPVASQLIRDDHPWNVPQALEESAEERFRGVLVAPTLHQDIEDMAVLVNGP